MKKISSKDNDFSSNSSDYLRKAVWLIVALTVCAGIVFAIATRFSYKDVLSSPQARDNAALASDEFISTVLNAKKIKDTTQNLLKAEFIAIAQATGECYYEDHALRYTLEVKKVYKGKADIGEKIDLYSTNFLIPTTSKNGSGNLLFLQQSVVGPMKQGKEYIIFASEKEFADVYWQSSPNKHRVFLAGNNLRFFYFPVEESEKLPIFDKPAGEYRFKDFKDADYIFTSEKQRDSVLKLKTAVFDAVNKL